MLPAGRPFGQSLIDPIFDSGRDGVAVFLHMAVAVQTQNVGRYGVRDDMKAASAIISSWLSLTTTGCISATASPLRVPF